MSDLAATSTQQRVGCARLRSRRSRSRGDGVRRSCAAGAARTVFDVSPSLAIEAARTRLRLFIDENPEAAGGNRRRRPAGVPADLRRIVERCGQRRRRRRAASISGCSSIRGSAGRPPIPSCGRTSRPTGEVAGHPDRALRHRRPGDGQVTRPAMFAINLTGGVTFGDVVRLYALEGIVRDAAGRHRWAAGRLVSRRPTKPPCASCCGARGASSSG